VSSFLKFVWEGSEYVALLISQMGRKWICRASCLTDDYSFRGSLPDATARFKSLL
jgi:hypothetical protein